jgi:hypothetical protein
MRGRRCNTTENNFQRTIQTMKTILETMNTNHTPIGPDADSPTAS